MRAGSLAIAWDACFISSRSSALRTLALGIEVGHPGHLNEFFLRLLEARDGIALPGFRFLRLATFFRLPLGLPLLFLLSLHRRFLLCALGARGIKPAALGVIEGGVLGPRAGEPFLELI
jgi:hypothetical protein